jgi:imidazolonepropionase-like amidohydrolase
VTRRARPCLRLSAAALVLAIGPAVVSGGDLVLHAGRVLDVRTGVYLEDRAVVVSAGRITAVEPWSDARAATPTSEVIDLTGSTVLPGLIDAHTHLLSRRKPGEDYAPMLVTRSQAYRTLEGAANASATLRAGFTTVRDVESEGAGFADAALRDAIARGLVPGPRMLVATRGIAALGYYFPLNVAPEYAATLTGAQMVSGVEETRKAAREQIRGGADVIKIYVDFLDPGGREMHPTLTMEEIRTAAEEAHRAGRKVAAHAITVEGIANAIAGGADSIEHGHLMTQDLLKTMAGRGIAWVPTCQALFDWVEAAPERAEVPRAQLEGLRKTIPAARRLGVRIASGSDASSATDHGRNARELVALTRLGMTPLEAVRAATTDGAVLLGIQDQVGAVEVGKRADLIAVRGDPLKEIGVLEHVSFVLKEGQVVRRDP